MKNFTRLLSLAIVGGGLIASLPAKADTYFRDSDRTVLRSYYTTTTTTPAPTHTVTYYTPGTVLPDTVTYTELPTTVPTKLVSPPEGSHYVFIDGNAYLVDHDRRIIDSEKLGD